jgi:hypothetical protein
MMLCYTILSIIWAMLFPKKPKETDAPPMRKGDPKVGRGF